MTSSALAMPPPQQSSLPEALLESRDRGPSETQTMESLAQRIDRNPLPTGRTTIRGQKMGWEFFTSDLLARGLIVGQIFEVSHHPFLAKVFSSVSEIGAIQVVISVVGAVVEMLVFTRRLAVIDLNTIGPQRGLWVPHPSCSYDRVSSTRNPCCL